MMICNTCRLFHLLRYFRTNKHGRISSFKFSSWVESESKGDCTPDELLEYYDALFVLTSHLKDPKNIIDHRLKPGQIIMFHNDRLLHGRSKLVSPEKKLNERMLQGAYFEWDAIFLRLRSLQKKLGLLTPYLPEQVDEFFWRNHAEINIFSISPETTKRVSSIDFLTFTILVPRRFRVLLFYTWAARKTKRSFRRRVIIVGLGTR